MPTVPRRPQAHRQRQQLQARRLRAAELFAAGVRAAEVARQLGVSRQAAGRWHAAWKAGGTNALASRGPTGPTPRLSDVQLVEVEQALRRGAVANGFVGELWTLDRIALVIGRLTGCATIPPTCGRSRATGWAGPSSARGAARPNATKPPSTTGSPPTGPG